MHPYTPHFISALSLMVALAACGHIVVHKRDSRSAALWVAIVCLVPILGSTLYVLLGINRIKKRAQRRWPEPSADPSPVSPNNPEHEVVDVKAAIRAKTAHLQTLVTLVRRVSDVPLLDGNQLTLLRSGDDAYPEMIRAIDDARESIGLCSYIFDNDHAGQQFAAALKRAHDRKVEVRVLIDSVGARYSRPSMVKYLQEKGLNVRVFNETRLSGRFRYANLRNHRKILVVDGILGFTGGMNIREGCLIDRKPAHPIKDLHCKVEGPVVAPLAQTFVTDWGFTTGESLDGTMWFPQLKWKGAQPARGLPDGPDEEADFIRKTLLGALATACESVQIITPYFLPDAAIISALNIASMRGIRVDIYIPEVNNLRLVQWACHAILWQVLGSGCHVWFVRPPFDHTKLMVVDGMWTFIGSANWDARSLRLNFEFNVECYDRDLAQEALKIVTEKRTNARQTSLEEMDSRPIWRRLRDGTARLFMPFL